jgi:hypothetical protein
VYLSTSIMGWTRYINPWVPEGHIHVTDGDDSGGTSPSRQGARTETSIPRNLSSTAAELRNCSGKNANFPRVFYPEALYRRRSVVRGLPGRPHA